MTREITASDPWSMSPWGGNQNIPAGGLPPGVKPPSAPQGPRAPRQKRAVPAIDELFDIQQDLVKALTAMQRFQADYARDKKWSDTEFRKLERNVKNAYRILNRYLRKYGAPGGQAGLGF